ncbi:MAG: GT4 family glycosyltransferase PelF [Cyanobacteria bacterium]|nr:GT4 family glycosyltransferase PelF [Cyanobacteriota bacterium]
MSALSVLLTTEGTYPYHKGGVSTWCDALTRQLGEVDFTLLSLAMHPYLMPSYTLHPNVKELVTVPLWGIEQPAEFRYESAFSTHLDRRWRTTGEVIAASFAPAFETLLKGISDKNTSIEAVAAAVVSLHEYCQEFDYDTSMRSEQAWDSVLRVLSPAGPRGDATPPPLPAVGELVGALRLLYHLLQPLALPLGRFDVAHSSAAAFCGLPCIVAKLKYGVPYLLTEHGVYIREQYLALRRSISSPFVRQFMSKLVNLIATLNYRYADLVAPVCAYNARWEEWWGVPPHRIRVIFNGADPKTFSPGPANKSSRPVVCTIGLIYPLKGQLDMIAAAALVRDQIPDVEFRLYGAPSDQEYFDTCRRSVAERGLENTVTFAGQTSTPWEALRAADVVAMASVSEAFPYSIIEAMLTGAAIVATDVGGVREALADTGVLVPPRQPRELANGILSLLHSADKRHSLGQAALSRALQHFSEQTFAEGYRQAYSDLASRRSTPLAHAS